METKTCSRCKETKHITLFSRNKARADGIHHHCKVCASQYKTNPDKRKAYFKRYNAEHSEKIHAYREAHREKMKAYCKNRWLEKRTELLEYKKQHYLKNKAVYIARNAKRHTSKMQRTPKWLTATDIFEIESIYAYAAALNTIGLRYHVDHIIPLQGTIVSGLHIPENLQVISAWDNISKGNRYAI